MMNCFVLYLVKKERGVFPADDVVRNSHHKKWNIEPMLCRSHYSNISSTPYARIWSAD